MTKLQRLPLDSPDWDNPALFDYSSVGDNVRIREIQNSPPGDRDNLIREFLDSTMQDMPGSSFYCASPYLVDIFTEDVGANWNGLKDYAQTIVIAMFALSDYREQVTDDKCRISKLMVDALELLETKETSLYYDCFKLFIGCIASVQGHEALGRHIKDADLTTL